MALAPGTKFGVYEVVATIGFGGMGEVYRAHDPRLGRDVALKVLPDAFASDPERLARFEREARVLASLNHPNNAAIYGLEEEGALKALVLELVEGPTLADRIAKGPVPLDEVGPMLRQIAYALEAAHEQGIVHRDLKPSNIKVRPDGTVKVLDFGLAKLADPGGGSDTYANVPTLTSPALMTLQGVVLGTAAYMSPEQARGKTVDRRTDVWAFGCVLYEMLAGTRPFDGEDMASVLGAVVRLEPDWRALPGDTPHAVVSVLKRCLQKDPNQRLRDIADVRLQLEDALVAPMSSAQPRAASLTRLGYVGWIAAALAAIASAVAVITSMRRLPAEIPETRLEIMTPPTDYPSSIAISPDGRSVVFEGQKDGGAMLWLRPLQSDEARPMMGTEGGTMPFWSADGRSLGFFAGGVLKRIDLASGFVRTLASAPQPRRGSWNSDGTILFGAASVGPLYKIAADGGAATPATDLLPGQTNHRWPQFLPDGQRFLVFALGAADVRGVYLGSLTDRNVSRVSDRESAYALLPPGHLLFARQGALWARRLNRESSRAEGDLIPVAPKVLVGGTPNGLGAFSASSNGSIVYRGSDRKQQLVWLDRSGRTVATVGPSDDSQMGIKHLSRDGRTGAVMRAVDGNSDVWLVDTERGLFRRLTSDAGTDGEPVFSPDGTRVVYVADGKADVYQIYERPSDGTGRETLLFESEENKNPSDWSPDGRYILYASQSSTTDFDIWALPLSGERKPVEVSRTRFAEVEGRFSPDGRWVTFVSSETGRMEIYAQPFPGPGPKVQISVGGGLFPRWRRDGRELFYLAQDSRLMVVAITERGSSLESGPPTSLFRLPATVAYEPSPDGQRFLVNSVVSAASPISVILNWKAPGR